MAPSKTKKKARIVDDEVSLSSLISDLKDEFKKLATGVKKLKDESTENNRSIADRLQKLEEKKPKDMVDPKDPKNDFPEDPFELDFSSDDDVRPKRRNGKKIHVPRPNVWINRPNTEETPSLSELSMPEFVFGFLHDIDREGDPYMAKILRKHLMNILEDAMAFPWATILEFHQLIVNKISQGTLSWEDQFEIHRIRLMTIMKSGKKSGKQGAKPEGATGGSSNASNFNEPFYAEVERQIKEGNSPCIPFQENKCSKNGHHENWLHVCEFCFKQRRKFCKFHTNASCISKKAAEQAK